MDSVVVEAAYHVLHVAELWEVNYVTLHVLNIEPNAS